MLNILLMYLIGMIFIGLPLAFLLVTTRPLTERMALATLIFYPIIAVALLLSGTIEAIKGLSDIIKLIIKGGTF